MSGPGGEDGRSSRASYPGSGCGGAGMTPRRGGRTLEVESSLGGPVGSTDWIKTCGTSREAYLNTREQCGSSSYAHVKTHGSYFA